MKFPDGLRYTEHDEWCRVEGDVVVLGISDFAQDALGELVHVELPAVGKKIAAGDEICEVESVKAVAAVYSPVSGEVVAINEGLDGNEGNVNTDPYGTGWLLKIKMSDRAGLDKTLDVASYRAKVAK